MLDDGGSMRNRALTLGTVAFGISFAIWGLISGLMPILKKTLALSASEASMLVALPVVLGSLGRIPVGILADRFGGKKVFSILMIAMLIPAFLLGFAKSYDTYLVLAALIGMAGTSFSVGVTFVSRWFPQEKQGTALGIYGAGNIGQSIAVFGTPALALAFGVSWAVWTFAAVAALYAIYFIWQARDAEWHGTAKSFGESCRLFIESKMCWILSLFYFQTFGGFVALAIYMPLLLKEMFELSPTDVGFRTAMFVVIATMCRPLGGWLSDRFSSRVVLLTSFVGLVTFGLIMTSLDLGYFTVGALGAATMVGLGNGAVFKLVPEFFPKEIGTATGLVGAAGGMGGFFPPLLLGYCKDAFGSFAPGFLGLSVFALVCSVILYMTLMRGTRKTNQQKQVALV